MRLAGFAVALGLLAGLVGGGSFRHLRKFALRSMGLGAAWVSMVRHHKPDFDVRITGRDLFFIVAGCFAFAIVIMPIFVRLKGE